MKKLLLLLLFPLQLLSAQEQIQLDSCYIWARKNYPNLKHSELWKEITSLKQKNLETSYLPRLSLNGQISYQSDVTEFPISIPGTTPPNVPKDRYSTYADLQQNIWDGGISAANKSLEDAILKSNLSQLEVELYKLNEQVAQAFFMALVADKQKAVLKAQIKTLNERLKQVESGIRNGSTEKAAAYVIQAEILKLKQNMLQLDAAKNTSVRILSILVGQEIEGSGTFTFQKAPAQFTASYLRPELQLFSNQHNQLSTQKELLSKTRNPKVYGFGKVGYGNPGLNLLLDEFKAYYLVGVGVSWNAFDWKNTSRKKQMLELQQEMLQSQEATFLQSLQLLLAQQEEQINKLKTMRSNDKEMLTLRTEITKSAASKLENETITASAYIQELQAETIARLNLELRKIQLHEAQEKYNLIKGKQ